MILAFALLACHPPDDTDDTDVADDTDAEAALPDTFTGHGDAEGSESAGTQSASCRWDVVLTDVVATDTGWTATLSGEVFRTVADGEAGAEFQALIGGIAPAVLVRDGDAVTLSIGGELLDDDPPFWHGLNALVGTGTADHRYEGTWECRPLDTELGPGVVDDRLTVPGTWTLDPSP